MRKEDEKGAKDEDGRYARNLEMLYINLSGLTMRLIAHNPGRTAT
jgi:hypothetical protein